MFYSWKQPVLVAFYKSVKDNEVIQFESDSRFEPCGFKNIDRQRNTQILPLNPSFVREIKTCILLYIDFIVGESYIFTYLLKL